MEIRREKQSKRSLTVEFKRQKRERKRHRTNQCQYVEMREGPTYASNIGMDEQAESVVDIPPPTSPPQRIQATVNNATMVYFDLETAGLGNDWCSNILSDILSGKTKYSMSNALFFCRSPT